MKVAGKSIAAAFAGLLLGWGAAGFSNHRENPAPVKNDGRGTHSFSDRKDPARVTTLPDLADVQACRDLLEISATPDQRHPLLRRLDRERALRRWIELDPAGALTEAERNPTADFARDLFRNWIELTPTGALDAMNRANQTLAGKVAKDFFLALVAKDPAMAMVELQTPKWETLGTTYLGDDFRREIHRQWLRSDPTAAIASLGPPPSGDLDRSEFGIMEVWGETDFKAAWSHYFPEVTTDKAFESSHAGVLIAKGLLAGSPEALQVLGSLPEKTEKDGRFVFDKRQDIADLMVRQDPHAALEWANSRPADDLLRLRILATAARPLASSDPEQALALLHESGGSTHLWENTGVLRESFAALAAEDPDGAAGRISKLSQGQRGDAMSGYLTRISLTNPDAAVEQCRAWLADPDLKNSLPKAWAQAFSWSHGAGPCNPGEMLEAIPELNDAVDGKVLSTWTKVDPEAAAGWIAERLGQGKAIGWKNEGILAELAISKPEFTASWLETLPDAAIQNAAAGTLTANWGAFDPVAARRWIDGLPEGELRQAAEAGLKRTNESR